MIKALPQPGPIFLATVLPGQLATTLLLMTGVGLFTAVFGLGAAWCVTFYKIPGKRVLEWGLMLPLAITYISAYAYAEAVDSTGPWSNFWAQTIPQGLDMRSLAGASVLHGRRAHTLCLYFRAGVLFETIGPAHPCCAGLGRRAVCLLLAHRLALVPAGPFCRSGIGPDGMPERHRGGRIFGGRTLTVGVYDTWLARGQLGAAVQMALVLLVLMAALISLRSPTAATCRITAAPTGRPNRLSSA